MKGMVLNQQTLLSTRSHLAILETFLFAQLMGDEEQGVLDT